MGDFLSGALQGFASTTASKKRSGDKDDGGPKGGLLGKLRNMRDKKKLKSATHIEGQDYQVPEFKRGGKVRKTGLARVHKGERVLTKRQSKQYRKRGGKRR